MQRLKEHLLKGPYISPNVLTMTKTINSSKVFLKNPYDLINKFNKCLGLFIVYFKIPTDLDNTCKVYNSKREVLKKDIEEGKNIEIDIRRLKNEEENAWKIINEDNKKIELKKLLIEECDSTDKVIFDNCIFHKYGYFFGTAVKMERRLATDKFETVYVLDSLT